MKMKIKKMIAIMTLGVIGITNINSIADNKTSKLEKKIETIEIIVDEEEMFFLEYWMINDKFWELKPDTILEKPLEIEYWMLNEETWK